VDVDENGTEAAATSVLTAYFGSASRPEPTIEVRIDRPFLFWIVDRPTSAVLFAGRIVDPAGGRKLLAEHEVLRNRAHTGPPCGAQRADNGLREREYRGEVRAGRGPCHPRIAPADAVLSGKPSARSCTGACVSCGIVGRSLGPAARE
jgi:hypothetical protein